MNVVKLNNIDGTSCLVNINSIVAVVNKHREEGDLKNSTYRYIILNDSEFHFVSVEDTTDQIYEKIKRCEK